MKNAMVVRIRFGFGPLVTRRKRNSRIAMLSASVLTLSAVCFASLGFWRLSQDVDFGGDFVFSDGFLSHWQVWIAAAIGAQYGAWRLNRFAKQLREEAELDVESASPETTLTARPAAAKSSAVSGV